MNARHSRRRPARWCALLGAGLLASAAVMAQSALTPAEKYQRDRQACQSVGSDAERKNCLREAGAALQAARQDKLATNVTAQQRMQNALSRCEVHKDPIDRQACERMVRGEGSHSGSVEDGAVVKEIVTRVVGEPGAAPAPGAVPQMPAPSAPSR